MFAGTILGTFPSVDPVYNPCRACTRDFQYSATTFSEIFKIFWFMVSTTTTARTLSVENTFTGTAIAYKPEPGTLLYVRTFHVVSGTRTQLFLLFKFYYAIEGYALVVQKLYFTKHIAHGTEKSIPTWTPFFPT